MKILPKLTVVTPTFNAGEDIEACLLNVADQSYQDKEHLIIDGISSDCTMEIVKRYALNFPHIKFMSERDGGIYDAMNKGIQNASGDWIYFLGCDDSLIDKNVLFDVMSLNCLEVYDLIYGNVLWGETNLIYDGKFSLLKLMKKNVCHQAMFFKKGVFDTFGVYDIKYKYLADYAYNLKIFASDALQIRYIDRIIAKFNFNGRSFSLTDTEFNCNEKDNLIRQYFPSEYIRLTEELKHLETCCNYNDQQLNSKNQLLLEKNLYIQQIEDHLSRLRDRVAFLEEELRRTHACHGEVGKSPGRKTLLECLKGIMGKTS